MDLNSFFRASLVLLCVLAFPVQAAELTGRIWYEHGKQVASGVHITITCPDNQRFSTRSDEYGFYRLAGIPPRQSCYIFIDDGQRYSEPLAFYSGQGRETQNFALQPQDQKLIVKKR